MDLIQQVKGFSDSREEEEFDEEVAAKTAEEEEENNITIPREESSSRLQEQDAVASNYNLMNERKQHHHQKLELLDLSLGRNKNKNNETKFEEGVVVIGGGCGSTTNDATCSSSISSTNNDGRIIISSDDNNVEKEHMFDKVVTPSDVGKLNRLVIPKQHAEKYFPLDSSSNEKGLLLNFEDRNGKLWRFRYSYWNSSQSYVMTKGWSRFVKDKKLDSGDIVSFKRGVGDLYRHRLYIDWKRRSDHNNLLLHDPSQTTILSSPLFLPNHYSIPWNGGRLYSMPSPNATTSTTMLPPQHNNHHFHHSFNYNNSHHQQQQLQFHQQYYEGCSGSGLGYLRSTPSMSMHQIGDQERGNIIAPMIIDSVPVTYQQDLQNGVGIASTSANNSGKMLRLFGVNMECSSSSPNDDSTMGTSSVIFDLDPSLQYKK